MALVECKECGEQVSNKAKTCPNCGAKAPRKTSLVTWIVLIFVIFVGYSVMQSPSTSSSARSNYSSTSSVSSGSNTAKTPPPPPKWHSFDSKDEMTGKVQGFAASPRVSSTRPMEFPYSGTQAWLGVGCDGKSEWAYVGFTDSPNLNDTDTKSGYNVVTTRVRWNETVQTTKFTQKWGAKFLHFDSYPAAIAKIAGNSTMLLELNWHGQQRVHFEFTLNGSSDAIAKMREICK